jgi:hypothetical protein
LGEPGVYVPPFYVSSEESERYQELENKKNEALIQRDFEKVERLSAEQDRLCKFLPVMTHSFKENAPYVIFHPQILVDWKTVIELSEMFLKDLG